MGDIKDLYKAVKDETAMLYEDALPENPIVSIPEAKDESNEPNMLNDTFEEPPEAEPFSFTILTLGTLLTLACVLFLIDLINK